MATVRYTFPPNGPHQSHVDQEKRIGYGTETSKLADVFEYQTRLFLAGRTHGSATAIATP